MAKTKGRRRYTPAEKKAILDTAAKESLTGAQVQKRFGIAQLTFYRWRGPVRGKKAAALASGKGGSPIQAEVRSRLHAILPEIIRQEVSSYLAEILGRAPGKRRGRKPGPKPGRRPGRPRKAK